ncbi:SMP-30/gluconolactonase/LRE family protein [Thermaerobacter subterraneus]|uniref:SMP-30/gluconolactonase/LRE family protein n=1 Tax=Thermaerobacter subterraneus TaxID=175696 RepID=UPI0002DD6D07|nr:SMP-30/gluconolactonase/LRE family protein [Thermaerobacter subterraneus]
MNRPLPEEPRGQRAARRRGFWATLLALALLAAVMGAGRPAGAATGGTGWFDRYPLPPGSKPWAVTVAPDGTVWVTLTGSRRLGGLDPATGRWRFVAMPREVRQPARLAAAPDGSLWLTDNDFGRDPAATAWRFVPNATSGSGGRWQAYPLPFAGAAAVLPAGDAVWLLQFQGNRLGRLDPATGRVEVVPLPLPDYPWPSTWDLARDEAGRLWTVSPRTGTVYRFDPRDGTWATFALPPDVAGPAGVAVTPDGEGVWVTEHGGRTIGRLDVTTRAWVPLLTPPAPPGEEIQATRPNDLEWDGQGRLWAALHTGNALARIDPATSTMELFQLPAAEPQSWVQWLARGPDGAIWFAAYGRDYVGRVDPRAWPVIQLAAGVEATHLVPAGTASVNATLVQPARGETGGPASGPVTWEVADRPRGWETVWEERGPAAARLRLTVPRDAEPGVYPLVLAARVAPERVVTRTVRVQVVPQAALPWQALAALGAMAGALVVGWLGVLAGIQSQRRSKQPRP